jgi:hypothetical protein
VTSVGPAGPASGIVDAVDALERWCDVVEAALRGPTDDDVLIQIVEHVSGLRLISPDNDRDRARLGRLAERVGHMTRVAVRERDRLGEELAGVRAERRRLAERGAKVQHYVENTLDL